MVPALTEAGYRVVTFDNRGVAPSSSPPAPYSIDDMVDDTVGLLDHLGLDAVHVAGYSMGGWIAETLAYRHPDRVRSASSSGAATSGRRGRRPSPPSSATWPGSTTSCRRCSTRSRRCGTCPTPSCNRTTSWTCGSHSSAISIRGRTPVDSGQYEAALAWSLDLERTQRWPELRRRASCSRSSTTSTPPRRGPARPPTPIPGARFVELAGASHLGVFTHAATVADAIVLFLSETAGHAPGHERHDDASPQGRAHLGQEVLVSLLPHRASTSPRRAGACGPASGRAWAGVMFLRMSPRMSQTLSPSKLPEGVARGAPPLLGAEVLERIGEQAALLLAQMLIELLDPRSPRAVAVASCAAPFAAPTTPPAPASERRTRSTTSAC